MIEPQIIQGEVKKGFYMLCSDGFRHRVTEDEIYEFLNFKLLKNRQMMIKQCQNLIKLIKQRGEKDDISVVLIKIFPDNKYRENNILDVFRRRIDSLLFGWRGD